MMLFIELYIILYLQLQNKGYLFSDKNCIIIQESLSIVYITVVKIKSMFSIVLIQYIKKTYISVIQKFTITLSHNNC